jgi:hypothetical protein
MKLQIFGPSREDIDQLAYELIVLHGLDAFDEAVRLSEVARLLPNCFLLQPESFYLFRNDPIDLWISFRLAIHA